MDFLSSKIKNFGTFHLVLRNWLVLGQNFCNIAFSLCSKLSFKTKKCNIESFGGSQQSIVEAKFDYLSLYRPKSRGRAFSKIKTKKFQRLQDNFVSEMQ